MSAAELKRFLRPYRTNPFGFSSDAAKNLAPSDDLLSLVLGALREREAVGVSLAGIVLEGIAAKVSDTQLIRTGIVDSLWHCIGSGESRIVESSLRTLGALGLPIYDKHRLDFRGALNSSEAHVRQAAIECATPDVVQDQFDQFLKFQTDTHVGEIGMNQPLRYVLRDLALNKLCQVLGEKLRLHEAVDNVEPYGPVYYWKWDEFLDSYDQRAKGSPPGFWRRFFS